MGGKYDWDMNDEIINGPTPCVPVSLKNLALIRAMDLSVDAFLDTVLSDDGCCPEPDPASSHPRDISACVGCGSALEVRFGNYGPFLSCPNWRTTEGCRSQPRIPPGTPDYDRFLELVRPAAEHKRKMDELIASTNRQQTKSKVIRPLANERFILNRDHVLVDGKLTVITHADAPDGDTFPSGTEVTFLRIEMVTGYDGIKTQRGIYRLVDVEVQGNLPCRSKNCAIVTIDDYCRWNGWGSVRHRRPDPRPNPGSND